MCHEVLLYCNLFNRFRINDLLSLGKMNVQDSFLDAGLDLFGIHIIREQKGLLEFFVGELAAQIPAVLLAFFILGLLFHLDMQIVVVVDMDFEVLFIESGSSKLDIVLFFVFNYVDGRRSISGAVHPAVVEEIIEDIRQPAIGCSSNR